MAFSAADWPSISSISASFSVEASPLRTMMLRAVGPPMREPATRPKVAEAIASTWEPAMPIFSMVSP